MLARNFVLVAVTVALIAAVANAEPKKPKVRPVNKLKIVDAAEKKVATVIGIPEWMNLDWAWIALKVDGHLVPLIVTRNGFRGQSIYFESNDCSEPGYLAAETGLVPHAAAVAAPGNTVYVGDPDAVPETITPTSVSWRPGSCGLCGVDAGCSKTVQVIPATPLIDLLTKFTPPFSIR